MVTGRYKSLGKVKLKIWDTNNFASITVMMPDHVYQTHAGVLDRGNQVVLTGLVFENLITKVNSFYCDKLVYATKNSLTFRNAICMPEGNITDWFDLRNYPSMKFKSHRIASLVKLRSSLVNQVHKLMNEEQFLHVTPPILTSWPMIGDEDAFMVKVGLRLDSIKSLCFNHFNFNLKINK